MSEAEWDEFVTEYSTIFSTPKWLDLVGTPYQLHVFRKGNELIGGLVDCPTVDVKLTPYHGLIVKQSEYAVAKNYAQLPLLNLVNHYSITDIRPFLWQGYKPIVRYTYVVSGQSPDKDTRYEINRAIKNGITVSEGTIEQFWDIYKETFNRKNLELPVDFIWFKDFNKLMNPKIYMTDGAGAVIISDKHRDYYIFAASTQGAQNTGASSLVLSTALSHSKEMDLVGCNNEQVGLFKRGFGGELKVCLGVTNV